MSINSYLTNLASSSIIRDSEKISINKSIENLQSKLKIVDSYFSNHFIFGSHSRGTILPRAIDENSDIDYMIVFNDNSKKPQSYLNFLRDKVASKYSRSEVYQSSPTIVLELNHIKFELVPAIKNNWGQLQIPAKASDSNDWIVTDPTGFKATLTSANQNHNNLIKPLIQLVKYWNVKAGYPYESFNLEQKVVNSIFYSNTYFKDYFYDFANSLIADYSIAQWKKDAIARFKRIVNEAFNSEWIGMAIEAETKIKRLFE